MKRSNSSKRRSPDASLLSRLIRKIKRMLGISPAASPAPNPRNTPAKNRKKKAAQNRTGQTGKNRRKGAGKNRAGKAGKNRAKTVGRKRTEYQRLTGFTVDPETLLRTEDPSD